MKTRLHIALGAAALVLAVIGNVRAQITISNAAVADAFVRANDPTHNFGGAGALSVSGTLAANAVGTHQGVFDSFERFNVASMAATFNTTFGVGHWTISSAKLILTESGAPNNAIFNRGVGPFEVRWMANDSWLEGTGAPNAPTTDGIVWNDEPFVLNASLDLSLGTFSNAGTDGMHTLTLATPSGFLNDITAGGPVSFFLTAAPSSTVGFTFNSRNFGTASARPFLELTAIAIPTATTIPEPSTICLLTLSVAALVGVRRRRSR